MNLQTLLVDPGAPVVELTGLSEHSREVEPGFAFINVAANAEDFTDHSLAAVTQGASAIICDPQASTVELAERLDKGGLTVPVVVVPELRARRGPLAAKFYADPSASLICIGVTGTNGKTSVAYHLADMSCRLGKPLGYGGTLGWGRLQDLREGSLTTGNAVALQRHLADQLEAGMVGAALEVSSHALHQDRAAAVRFDYGIFTNLSRDHLDYHGTFEAYAEAKAKLFMDWPLRAAIVNVDDEFGLELAARCSMQVITYGKTGQWRWHTNKLDSGLAVSWETPAGNFDVQLPIVADFAIANVTAAMATLVVLGHDVAEVFASLDELRGVPGRLEVVGASVKQPTVVVDYAHTPDALAKVLAALRPFCQGQLVCVVGCGGDRDTGKRPLMGAAAANGADLVWLTSDNPRSESPEDIVAAMRAGIDGESVVECIDRGEAIRRALAQAKPADVVLVAGKGHEDYQEIGARRLPFDDRLVVEQALRELD